LRAVARVGVAADAVLRAEERHHLDVFRPGQEIDGADPVSRPAGLVRQQADALAAQAREAVRLEYVDAG
jgi:hypothetical protein